jgi:hypothetical protein
MTSEEALREDLRRHQRLGRTAASTMSMPAAEARGVLLNGKRFGLHAIHTAYWAGIYATLARRERAAYIYDVVEAERARREAIERAEPVNVPEPAEAHGARRVPADGCSNDD